MIINRRSIECFVGQGVYLAREHKLLKTLQTFRFALRVVFYK